ncbi:SRPBCC family protein [Actibacterium sp. D379-3]
MKFSTREDIAAPMSQVFAAVSDFDVFERAILRRGVELSRTDMLPGPGPGMTWKSRFTYRGRPRELTAELTHYQTPELLVMKSHSAGLDGALTVELLQLSPRQTRMAVALDLKPNTITARLFLQSLRLAKSSLTRRYKKSVHIFARDLETRLGAGPRPG